MGITRMNKFSFICYFLIAFFFLASWLNAANGKIAGRVYNLETGEPLPGANVIIESYWDHDRIITLDQIIGTSTTLDGYYFLLNISPRTYNIKATMIGYQSLTQQQIRVNMDRTIAVDFPLNPKVIELEGVEVIAKQAIIKPDVSGTQEIITTERISQATVMRVDEFVNKIKGVELVSNNEGHGLSVRGGNIGETDVRIDGISARDPRSENSYLSLNSTAIEELQVLTGGFQAKYGGFRSGLVNVITKEGSREKFSISIKLDYTHKNQRKFFGQNPWSDEFPYFQVFGGQYAMDGVPDDTTVIGVTIPDEEIFTDFRGWNHRRSRVKNLDLAGIPKGTVLTPEQKRALWLLQHPQYDFADQADKYLEGTLTGPVPGSFLPVIGPLLERSTFMFGGKIEDTQFAFPIGPTNNYLDFNYQTKITTRLTPSTKFSFNWMAAVINTITAGRPTDFGGALIDESSRFNFLTSTEVSVIQQAGLLAGTSGLIQMFNKSRLQFYDQQHVFTGVQFNHALSSRSFFNLELQYAYVEHSIKPFQFDPGDSTIWVPLDSSIDVINIPQIGTPNASTNFGKDIGDYFYLYGGLQASDSSYSRQTVLKGNYLIQLNRHNELEAGIEIRNNYIHVNSGTWYQSQKSFTPDTWQYYTARPLEVGVYIQDKLEYEGLIANIGLRADYLNVRKDSYQVYHPLDKDYSNFYNLEYQNLPGDFGSWERWIVFRDLLAEPPGWPTKKNKPQLKISPRLGISFPVTISSKIFFNYGHFYQKPNVNFLYNMAIMPGATNIPSTDLEMAKTVAYELGYEQVLFDTYLLNAAFYYKNISNEPLNRTYVDWWEEMHVNRYFPDAFRDIRGLELRFEKNRGKYVTFWSNYEYLLQSWGRTGLAYVYENQLKADQEARNPNTIVTEPRPAAQVGFNFHTPDRFGPHLFNQYPFRNLALNLFLSWRDGGDQIINPQDPERLWRRIEIMDYFNLDLRASKSFSFGSVNMEVLVTIQNLLNIKRLSYGNMTSGQFDNYRNSLYFGDEYNGKDRDKLGEYDRDETGWEELWYNIRLNWYNIRRKVARTLGNDFKANEPWRWGDNEHIDVGWYEAPLFLNPRSILIGVRFNF